jgi:PAS domain S-box-containing protein
VPQLSRALPPPPSLSLPRQYLLALVMAVAGLLLREALQPWLGQRAPFLPVFAALLVLVVLVRPGPFLAAAALCGVVVGARLWNSSPRLGLDLALFAAVVAIAGVAAWLSGRTHQRQQLAWRQAAEQRDMLRVTLSSIGDAVISTDVSGCISFMNHAAGEVTGWPPADAVGHPLAEVYRTVDEASRAPLADPVARVLRGAAHAAPGQHVRLLRKDGSECPIDDSAAAIRAADGSVSGVVLVFRDVTERRAAERTIAESEHELAELFESASIGMQWVAPDGRILRANRTQLELLGATRSQVLGQPLTRFHGDGDPMKLFMAPLLAGEAVVEHTAMLQRLDGGWREVLIRASPRVADGRVVHARFFTLDITERRKGEAARAELVAQLRHADRRKDEFLATLAHELRNPLAPVLHGMDILANPAADSASQARARATISRQLRHMVRLIDDLLDVSRITQDRLELRTVSVPLHSVLEQAVEAVRPALAAAGHALAVQHLGDAQAEDGLWLQADPVRLAQVFTNLLGNACKYSPPGSALTLQVSAHEGTVEVAVADQGIGIAPDLLPRIFEMFTQGAPAPGQASGGLGIGLALARRLVLLHGGEISAHSDGPGQGSRFSVRLPLMPQLEAPAPAADPPAAPPASAASAVWRLLVVDDNRDAAMTLAMLLELAGHSVRMAHDGEEAMRVAEQFRPDAVLLDIGLPLLDGHAVARRLRSLPWARETVLIALTGWGQPPDRQASMAAGFDAHLVKPVEHAQLLEVLGSLLQKRQLAQEALAS